MISCSNNNSFEDKKVLVDESFVKEYSENSLIKEKFLEFYDLNLLLENKPEFKKNIKERLYYFTLDSNKVLNLNKTSKIKKVNITKCNSENAFKISFELKSEGFIKKDSIFATIIEQNIVLDLKKTTASKVKFSRFN